MSVRGLVGIRVNGQLIAGYIHNDASPETLGQEICTYCKNLTEEDVKQIASNALKMKFMPEYGYPTQKQLADIKKCGMQDWLDRMTEEELARWEKYGSDSVEWYKTRCLYVHNHEHYGTFYWLFYMMQGINTLEAMRLGMPYMIQNAESLERQIDLEYAYFLDCDRNVVEFWKMCGQMRKVFEEKRNLLDSHTILRFEEPVVADIEVEVTEIKPPEPKPPEHYNPKPSEPYNPLKDPNISDDLDDWL